MLITPATFVSNGAYLNNIFMSFREVLLFPNFFAGENNCRALVSLSPMMVFQDYEGN